jgi:hypothetical protein
MTVANKTTNLIMITFRCIDQTFVMKRILASHDVIWANLVAECNVVVSALLRVFLLFFFPLALDSASQRGMTTPLPPTEPYSLSHCRLTIK